MKRILALFYLLIFLFASSNPALAQTISTIAGGGSVNGVNATASPLPYPTDVAFDAAGNQYVVCNAYGSVRKITTAGIITTVAGGGAGTLTEGGSATAGTLGAPNSVAIDGAGNLYISDLFEHKIRKVNTAGIISTFAGNGSQGFSGDGGLATGASLNLPCGLKFDLSGNLLFVDLLNNRVRKISTSGIISTVAGTGIAGYNGDGISATSAQLNYPQDLTVDASGNIYIADVSNNRVRKINTSGIISTVAGNGMAAPFMDGPPASVALNSPVGVTVNAVGALYIACSDNRIRYVPTTGNMLTAVYGGNAGGEAGFSGDGGSSITARINAPWSMAVDASNNLFVADENNNRVRKITAYPSWIITTTAGTGANDVNGNGGPATNGILSFPYGIFVDRAGALYFPEGHRIRKVAPNGIITTIAGNGVAGFSGDGGLAANAQINSPISVYIDNSRNVYFGDALNKRIRKINSAGMISTFAGNGVQGYSGNGGLATSASIGYVQGITGDIAGNIYFTDFLSSVVRKVNTAGIISTIAGTAAYGYSGDGGPATSAQLRAPNGISIDAAGNLYVGDNSPNNVRKINTAGIITTVAGSSNTATGNTGDGGLATSALFGDIKGVFSDAIGDIYIADRQNNNVRRVNASTGVITTFAGAGTSGFSGDGGLAINAQLNTPGGVMQDTAGNFFIADAGNNRIRKVTVTYSLSTSNIAVNQTLNSPFATNIDDNNFRRILTIAPTQGANMLTGNVSFQVRFDGGVQAYNGKPYVQRHYDIVPSTNAASAQASIKLYFLQSEFDAYNSYVTANNANVPLLPTGGVSNGSIIVNQYHGTGTAPGNYSGNAVNISPAVVWNSTSNWWEVSFPVNGFSGFYVSTANTPLPLTLVNFTGTLQNNSVTLNWTTANENNAKDFVVERSADQATGFVAIGSVSAMNSVTTSSYRFTDNNLLPATYFYRLKMNDRDARYRYSNVVSLKTTGLANTVLVYPNPVKDRLHVQWQSSTSQNLTVQIADAKGMVLKQQQVQVNPGSTGFSINTETLPAGNYLLICSGDNRTVSAFIKQ